MSSRAQDFPYGLHWFRRDLRLEGNPALRWNLERHSGKVLGIFFFDGKFLSRPDFSSHRFAFFIETLLSLREELRAKGGDLLVLDSGPDQGFRDLISLLGTEGRGKPSAVSFNRDYEPFARERDSRVTQLLKKDYSIDVHTDRDHLLIEPHEITKAGEPESFYQVYSPFSRRWFEKLKSPEIQKRIRASLEQVPPFSLRWSDLLSGREIEIDRLEAFRTENLKKVLIPIPNAGTIAAKKCLEVFKKKISNYKEKRDFPADRGTSQISIYLKNGSLTTSQVIGTLGLSQIDGIGKTGLSQYLKELAWREFYYHILWHCPRVESEEFLTHYKSITWENREDYFLAWKEGKTGYPLVDAGMRQLKCTGWMHNRVRMVVASFLTKDLLIDWKWGERYFMEQLLDGDLAPNNGGWQWAASTGCDPQPYFRIFNPTLQAEKFDPSGAYIKHWLQERAGMSGAQVHEPINPIVVHEEQRTKVLALYKKMQT